MSPRVSEWAASYAQVLRDEMDQSVGVFRISPARRYLCTHAIPNLRPAELENLLDRLRRLGNRWLVGAAVGGRFGQGPAYSPGPGVQLHRYGPGLWRRQIGANHRPDVAGAQAKQS